VTSNAELRRGFKVPVVGTMGHEWIQSFGDEAEAFDKWLEHNPDRPTLLVDTIDTLRSGLPHAIAAFKKHEERIRAAGGRMGIRNDSGDLAYITIEERMALDKAGLADVLIYETNDLDEHLIQDIKEQIFTVTQRTGANAQAILEKIIWAAGTMPGTCYDQPSLGGVAKLTSIENGHGDMRAVIKLAKDNPVKCSIPGSNRSFHAWSGGELIGCVIHAADEDLKELRIARHPDDYSQTITLDATTMDFEKRQARVLDTTGGEDTVAEVRDRVRRETARLHWTVKRFANPHQVKVSLSPQVFGLRSIMTGKNLLIQADA
jgi:nicotinate phosphoribosyltransferase